MSLSALMRKLFVMSSPSKNRAGYTTVSKIVRWEVVESGKSLTQVTAQLLQQLLHLLSFPGFERFLDRLSWLLLLFLLLLVTGNIGCGLPAVEVLLPVINIPFGLLAARRLLEILRRHEWLWCLFISRFRWHTPHSFDISILCLWSHRK